MTPRDPDKPPSLIPSLIFLLVLAALACVAARGCASDSLETDGNEINLRRG